MSKARTYGIPKPQNGRIFVKVVTIEHRTKAGIIIPDGAPDISRSDMRNNIDRAYDPRPLIAEVIDFAPELTRVKVKAGDHIMIDRTYAEKPTQVGEHSFIVIHEMDVLGIWPEENKK